MSQSFYTVPVSLRSDDTSPPLESNVIRYLLSEFGRQITEGDPRDVLPHNKRLTKREAIKLLKLLYHRVDNLFWAGRASDLGWGTRYTREITGMFATCVLCVASSANTVCMVLETQKTMWGGLLSKAGGSSSEGLWARSQQSGQKSHYRVCREHHVFNSRPYLSINIFPIAAVSPALAR